jgi:hypothetical protein
MTLSQTQPSYDNSTRPWHLFLGYFLTPSLFCFFVQLGNEYVPCISIMCKTFPASFHSTSPFSACVWEGGGGAATTCLYESRAIVMCHEKLCPSLLGKFVNLSYS